MKKVISISLSVLFVPVYWILRFGHLVWMAWKKVLLEPYWSMKDFFDHQLGIAKPLKKLEDF